MAEHSYGWPLAADGLSHLVVANTPDSMEGLEALSPVLEVLDREG